MVTDDLDGVLVGADGTIGTQAVELAGDRAGGSRVDLLADGQGSSGHIIVDADGEVVLGSFVSQVIKDRLDVGRVELLGAHAVTAADDLDIAAGFVQRSDDIQVKGLAQGAGLLGAVEHRDLLDGGGDRFHELFHAEGAIQVNLHHTDLDAAGVHVIDGLLGSLSAGAHDDHDLGGVGIAVVVEQVVGTAGQLGDLLHFLLDDGGNSIVILVRRFAVLEVDVAVLRSALLMGMLGVHRAGAELGNLIERTQLGHILVVDHLDLLNLVRGAEAVEEVQERNRGTQGGQVSHQRQVHSLLHGVGCQHRKTGLTAGHHVGMIAEDVQRVSGKGAGGDVEDAGQQLAGDLVHVRDHQQQALGRGESRSQRASDQRAVHGAGCAGLGLHLGDLHLLTEEVETAVGSPLIRRFGHGGRRSDGVDGRDVTECICNVARSRVPINGHFLAHDKKPP